MSQGLRVLPHRCSVASGDDAGIGPLGRLVGLAVVVQVDDRETQVAQVVLGDAAVPVPGPARVGAGARVERVVRRVRDRGVVAVLGGALLSVRDVRAGRPVGAEALDVELDAVGLAAGVRVEDERLRLELGRELVADLRRAGRQAVDDVAGLAGAVLDLARAVADRAGRVVDAVAGSQHADTHDETGEGTDRLDEVERTDVTSHGAAFLPYRGAV